jgi:hypothetical protein
LLSSGANKVLQSNAVTIAGSGKIDLADNKMIVNYGAVYPSPIDAIRQLISTGYNNGSWDGNGITTSSGTPTRGLGYGESSLLGITTFGGISITSPSVLVKYTYLGDANLDGKVDIQDLMQLASHWNQTSQVWTGGDFNYDGVVNVSDLYALAKDWQDGVSSPLAPSLAAIMTGLGLSTDFSPVNVPEPTALGLLGIICMGSLRRRRRRAHC